MNRKDIIENFAEENNLQIKETTTGRNGYPENIRKMITGFDNWEQLQSLLNLLPESDWNEIKSFKIRDGWHFHQEEGYLFEPYTHNDYLNKAGDNYNEVNIDAEFEFLGEQLSENYDNLNLIKDISNRLTSLIFLLENEDFSEDNKAIIYHEDYEVMPHEFMSYNHDVWTYRIGIYLN